MLSPQHTMPTSTRVLDELPTLRTNDPREAQQRISDLFCEHTLQPLSGRKNVRLNLRSTGQGFGVHLLDYGTAVRISPGALKTFYMVQVPLSGSAQLRSGQSTITSTPALASVPPVDSDFSMTWQAGTPQLIVTAPRKTLETAASSLYGAALEGPLKLANSMATATHAGQAFLRAVFEFHDMVNNQAAAPAPYVKKLYEELILSHWLMAVSSNFSSSLSQWETPSAEVKGSSVVQGFTDLLAAHSSEDLAIGEIAEALGVSIRTLQIALAKELDATPSQLLREARLRRAHEMLSSANPLTDSVTEIAGRCGFGHLGRFAQAYRQHFGFPPSHTLRENRT